MKKNKLVILLLVNIVILVGCGGDQTSFYTSSFSTYLNSNSQISENVIGESQITESSVNENTNSELTVNEIRLYEKSVIENSIQEITELEIFKREDVKLESIIGLVFEDWDEYEEYLESYSIIGYEFDIEEIKKEFNNQLRVFVIDSIINVAGVTLSIITKDYIGLFLDLSRLIITVGTVTIGTFINNLIVEKLGNSIGLSQEQIEYDRIEKNLRLFQVVTIINFPFTILDTIRIAQAIASGIKNFVKSLRKVDLFDGNKYIGTLKGKKIYSNVDANDAKNVIGKLDSSKNIILDDGDVFRHLGRISDLDVPRVDINDLQKVFSTGDRIVDGKKIYNITKNADGTFNHRNYVTKNGDRVLSKRINLIDESGWIIKNSIPIKQIDLATGEVIADISLAIKNHLNVGVDGVINSTKVIEDGKTFFLNNNNIKVAYVENDYIKLISNKLKDNGMAIGKIDELGDFVLDWKIQTKASRLKGTNNFRNYIAKVINHIKDRPEVRSQIVPQFFTPDEFKYIVDFNRLPPGKFQIHHKCGVKFCPEFAELISNMEPLRTEQHRLLGHGGDYRNPANNVFPNWDFLLWGTNLGVTP